ncbi:hypothetical protein JCGZ_02448 [Jatropha curcas]|uniref:Uncharacterized protein n=1 Tax=Jatropha curcas TaxID=180498 RepID=A0A067L1P9_JATCU|nr:hypothetical protein JCGZ_02448 [Jatropha curcas]
MEKLCLASPTHLVYAQFTPHPTKPRFSRVFASNSRGFSLNSGTGKNKKNGNIFERWK